MTAVDPAARRPDAFLSYSRRDRELADRLAAVLEERGKDVWVDVQDIPAASRWRDELARAIEVSDAVIALVTPAWVASENCRQEIEHADAAGKRIVPLLATATGSIPEVLTARQWVELGAEPDWAGAADEIVAAIETDLPYVRAHARYLEESQRWGASGRDRGFLLRGGELRAAEEWLATRSERREPRPTAEQIAFVQASRSDATRRLRVLTASACVATVLVVALGIVALLQRNVAVDREHLARSRELAALSEVRRATDPELAVRLAMQGLGESDTGEAQIALRRAIRESPLVARFGGPRDEVNDAAITADGRTVVTARRDGLVRAFDTSTGDTRWSWTGLSGLQSVAVAPGGREVAVGQAGVVEVLGIDDGRPITRFSLGAEGESTVGVPSPDGRTIAGETVQLGDLRGVLKLWERGTGREIADLSADDLPFRPVFGPGGRIVAVPYRSGNIRVWDARTGRLLHLLDGHAGSPVNRVDVDPRGRWIASAADDGHAVLWDAATGARVSTLVTSDRPLRSVRFSPDGRRAAVTGADGLVYVCDVPSGDVVAQLSGHEAAVVSADFLDARTLVTGSDDGTARVWDLDRFRQSAVLLGHGLGVRIPGGTSAHLLTVGEEGTARVWRLPRASGRTIGAAGSIDRFSVARDGELLTTARTGGPDPALWALAPDGLNRRLATDARAFDADISADGSLVVFGGVGLRLAGDDGQVRDVVEVGSLDVAAGPDGHRIAARVEGDVELRSGADGSLVARVPGGERVLFPFMSFSRDGSAVGTADLGSPIVVADAETGVVIGSVPSPEVGSLPDFAIDPTGDRVFRIAYGFPREPVIVDVRSGARTPLSGSTAGALDSAVFSSDGALLLTAGGGAAQIWNAADGGLIRELGSDRSRTSTAAFSPDDRLVVTGHDDGMVRVWDRETGAMLGEFDVGTGPVAQVAIAFGGERILAVGKEQTLRMLTCDACAPSDRLPTLAADHVAFGDLDPG